MIDYTPTIVESLGNEIARVRKGQNITAGDLAQRLEPWLSNLLAEKQAEARRDVILRDVRKAVGMALAFVPWPRAGEEYDAGLMVDALTKEFIDAQRLREQAIGDNPYRAAKGEQK